MSLNNLIKTDIKKLDTMTKYPSILTFHSLGERGALTEELNFEKEYQEENPLLYATEKVDGTNTRIIIADGDYLIGSRKELLFAKGDRVINNNQGIVNNVLPIAEKLKDSYPGQTVVIYGETYGGGINGSKNYTKSKQYSFRIFDVTKMDDLAFEYLFANNNIEYLASWRDHNQQPFISVDQLKNEFSEYTVPDLFQKQLNSLPTNIEGMYKFMSNGYKETLVGIDNKGRSEGFVVRSVDRKFIRKIRFEDYERTLKRRK